MRKKLWFPINRVRDHLEERLDEKKVWKYTAEKDYRVAHVGFKVHNRTRLRNLSLSKKRDDSQRKEDTVSPGPRVLKSEGEPDSIHERAGDQATRIRRGCRS